MKILKRTEFGNPMLRAKARKVSLKDIRSVRFKRLVERMTYTMRRTQGVGIAAPQVGKPFAVAIIETRPTPARPRLKKRGPLVIVNPKIISYSRARRHSWEGCLSLPGVRGQALRSRSVTVEYHNREGKRIVEKIRGLWAQIFQHEVDHLNGILYVDRVKRSRSFMAVSEYKKRVLKLK
jgi:peptide deformylase